MPSPFFAAASRATCTIMTQTLKHKDTAKDCAIHHSIAFVANIGTTLMLETTDTMLA